MNYDQATALPESSPTQAQLDAARKECFTKYINRDSNYSRFIRELNSTDAVVAVAFDPKTGNLGSPVVIYKNSFEMYDAIYAKRGQRVLRLDMSIPPTP